MNQLVKEVGFANEFYKLFNSAIRQREFLLLTYRSQRHETTVRQAMDRLLPYQQMKFSNEAAARFILKYEMDIISIIPARQTRTIEKFYSLYQKAKQLT